MPIKRCVFAAFFWASLLPSIVSAETITNFKVDARLEPDRRLSITENITYDFEDEQRHGIYREIPVTYLRNSATYKLRLRNIRATMDGQPVQTEVTEDEGRLKIRLGDPDEFVTGRKTYAISYETERAINFFDGRGELYWNVTGNEWGMPIEQARFSLTVPFIAADQIATSCFTGPAGSTEASCEITPVEGGVAFETKRLLNPAEGFTIVTGFPSGAIQSLAVWDTAWMIFRDNAVLGWPLLFFILMFYAWWTRGRDPKLGTVIPHYEPPQKMSPAELGAVVEEGALPPRGVTATVIDLARRGYLRIRYEEKKWLFIKGKEPEAELPEFERAILNPIFVGGGEVKLTDLQTPLFHDGVQQARDLVWKKLEAKKFFHHRPAMVRVGGLFAGAAAAWLGMFFFGGRPLGVLSAILSGAIIAVFGWFMPRRTQEGTRFLADIKGFEWFLSVTEKDRLAFHNAPERTPEQFEKFLSYAIALGVEKAWAEQFAGMTMKPPAWMEGNLAQGWAISNLVADIGTVNAQIKSAATSQAGSGGSGFSGGGSGGGFGGGGGGSW